MKQLLPFIIVFFTGVFWGFVVTAHIGQKNAIENECAWYNPKTGDFQWNNDKLE